LDQRIEQARDAIGDPDGNDRRQQQQQDGQQPTPARMFQPSGRGLDPPADWNRLPLWRKGGRSLQFLENLLALIRA
jgi:hypothetical protein